MQFINLQYQYESIKQDVNERIQKVLDHGKYISGPEIQELESKLASFVGVKHCIGMSSGTDALLVAMMALGIKPQDEVITTPFSFMATAETIALLGAKPIFVDIDPRTYNIDPKKIAGAITAKTKLIMPVSLYGQCADFDEINKIAKQHNIPVLEDGAQSFGAMYKGRMSCGLTDISATSFFPSKTLGCYGDGGACFTDDDKLAAIMKEVRDHGQDRRYHHIRVGINGRLDTLQAAILLAKLEIFPKEVELRKSAGDNYTRLLKDHCVTPFIEEFNTSVYAQYTVLINERDAVQEKLKAYDIPTAIHYPIPLNKQPIFEAEYGSLALPVTEDIAKRVISLPMHAYITDSEQRYVAEKLIECMSS